MNDKILSLLAKYQTPVEAKELIKKSKIVFLVGISGAGKDTVINELLKKSDYNYVVSHTTRKPRTNRGIPEKNGVEYFFIDEKELVEMLDKKQFVEAKVFSGNVYGTSIASIESAARDNQVAISEIEVQGVAAYKAISKNVISIFLVPPDYDTWQERLRHRYKDKPIDPSEFARRIQTAHDELSEALSKDYYEFVINDDLERAVWAVDQIVKGNTSSKKSAEGRKVAEELLAALKAND